MNLPFVDCWQFGEFGAAASTRDKDSVERWSSALEEVSCLFVARIRKGTESFGSWKPSDQKDGRKNSNTGPLSLVLWEFRGSRGDGHFRAGPRRCQVSVFWGEPSLYWRESCDSGLHLIYEHRLLTKELIYLKEGKGEGHNSLRGLICAIAVLIRILIKITMDS